MGPLAFVLISQFFLCLYRLTAGDTMGAIEEGVAVTLGTLMLCEATSLPALLYGAVCAIMGVYDTAMAWNAWKHTRLAGDNHRWTAVIIMASAVLVAPMISWVGALLSVRLYGKLKLSCDGDAGECKPLARHLATTNTATSTFVATTSSAPGGASFLPPPPTPPLPPLCSRGSQQKKEPPAQPVRSPMPFQAIFGAPVEKKGLLPSRRQRHRSPTPPPPLDEAGAVL
jgi:hypothetical protein